MWQYPPLRVEPLRPSITSATPGSDPDWSRKKESSSSSSEEEEDGEESGKEPEEKGEENPEEEMTLDDEVVELAKEKAQNNKD